MPTVSILPSSQRGRWLFLLEHVGQIRTRRSNNDDPSGIDDWLGSRYTTCGYRPEFAFQVRSGGRDCRCCDSTLDRRSSVGSTRTGSG